MICIWIISLGKLFLFLLERFSIAVNFYLLFGISDGLFDILYFEVPSMDHMILIDLDNYD